MNRVGRILTAAALVVASASAVAFAAGEEASGEAAPEGDKASGKAGLETVVQVGDRKFNAVQLKREFGYLPPPQLAQLHEDDNAARIFAVKWYADVLFAEDAVRNGFLKRQPGIRSAAAAAGRRLIAFEYQKDLKTREYPVEEKELRQLYDLDQQKICTRPAGFHLAVAGVTIGRNATAAEKAAALARMDEIVSRLEAGEDFTAVAEELSDLSGRKPGGDLGWVTAAELGTAAGVDEVTSLPAGGRTRVIETPQGRALYAMKDRREAEVLSFEQCRPALENSLQARFARDIKHKRVDELAEELGASMNIDAFIAALRAAPVPEGWEQTWGREPR